MLLFSCIVAYENKWKEHSNIKQLEWEFYDVNL